MYAHLEQDVPEPSSKRADLPRSLDEVVTKATAKRPADRFATAGEMAGALRGSPLPDGAWKDRGRRRIGIAVLALVVIASVVGFVALRDEETPPASPTQTSGPAPIPLNSLVQVDAETGDLLATAPSMILSTLQSPAIAVGEGGVWILSSAFGQPRIVQFDVDDASLVERIALAQTSGVASIAVGSRTVWVGAPPGIVRIDPIDSDLLRPVRLYPPESLVVSQVALGEGSAWAVAGDGELSRVDPTTGLETGRVDVGQGATGLAVGFGAVWVTDDLQGTLTRVDPETLVAEDPMQIGGSLNAIEAGAGAVWILDKGAGVVTPIDPVDGTVGSPIRVGVDPSDLAVGLDAVWVANAENGTISRIDPSTRVPETIPIGSPVAAIAVDKSSQSLWIVVARRVG